MDSGRRALFLDRDGVLVAPLVTGGTPRPPWSVDELALLPHAQLAVQEAATAGFVPVIVTNQPDVARGQLPRELAVQINDHLVELMPAIASVQMCPHDNDDGCPCRKPRPGMLYQAADAMGLDLAASWLIGDRWVDIAAAAAAGCRSVLIRSAASWAATSAGTPPADVRPTLEATNVLDAVRQVVSSD